MGIAAIICIFVMIVVFSVRRYAKKLVSSCCGGEDGLLKGAPGGRAKGYPFLKLLEIDGMTCIHRARRLEHALNELDGVRAEVDLRKGTAAIYMQERLPDAALRAAVCRAGCTVVGAGADVPAAKTGEEGT